MRARRTALAAVVALLAVPAVLAAGCGGDGGERPADPARAAADRFLDRYLASDGRVVRRDEGGDTVSEGQAYAMLLAAATGDERRFDAAWRWTRRELQRDDGLLAWRWAGGRVVDDTPAADADLDAARALALAARRFDRPALRRQARRIADAILRHETAGDQLVAGPWAVSGHVVNPSYDSPAAARVLGRLGQPDRWRRVRSAGIRTANTLTAGGRLPPDWAVVGSRSDSDPDPTTATAAAEPGGEDLAPSAYGFDAVRLPVRYAEACDPVARRVAARLWPTLRSGDPAVLPRTPDGRGAEGAGRHAVALVGAAAAADAAGDGERRDELLDAAARLDAERPSYYGAAWVALGRVLLARPCGR